MTISKLLRHLGLLLLLGAGTAFAAQEFAASASKPAKTSAAKKAKAAEPVMAAEPIRTVYHLNEGLEQASNALRNVGNHLSVDPTAKIVVVAHAKGIDYLLQGAQDKGGNVYATKVEELVLKGVDFRICNFTLQSRNIDPKTVHPDAKIVPSGVAEVAMLQAREGFAYVKP